MGQPYNHEERIKRNFKVVKFPNIGQEPRVNRGIDECCCVFDVYGSGGSNQSQKMYTSAWLRDVQNVVFRLVKSNSNQIIIPTQNFVNEQNAVFCTVDWSSILVNPNGGAGCYDLFIDYNFLGNSDTKKWGSYSLSNFDELALDGKVMLTSIFNSFQTFEDINFKDSNVKDSILFKGWFGNSQDGMLVENLIYETRETKKSFRENVVFYEMTAQSQIECVAKRLREQHLLNENQMFVSDFNAFNHSRYYNVPVIVAETPSVKYSHPLATITVKLEDKFKNKRSKYTR